MSEGARVGVGCVSLCVSLYQNWLVECHRGVRYGLSRSRYHLVQKTPTPRKQFRETAIPSPSAADARVHCGLRIPRICVRAGGHEVAVFLVAGELRQAVPECRRVRRALAHCTSILPCPFPASSLRVRRFDYRLSIFTQNVALIDSHNAAPHTYWMEANELADLLPSEISASRFGAVPPSVRRRALAGTKNSYCE